MAKKEGEKVRVLGFWASPFSPRVEWGLKLKGIEYEYIEEDIFNKSHLLLELNPAKQRVPVLVHGRTVVAESLIILEYIDETWNQSYKLLPSDPGERAKARFWAQFSEHKVLEPTLNALCSVGGEQDKAVKKGKEAMQNIETTVMKGVKTYLGGDQIGFFDISLGWLAYWLPILDEAGSTQIMDPHSCPATSVWAHKFVNHPLVKPSLPSRDKLVDYFKDRREVISSIISRDWITF